MNYKIYIYILIMALVSYLIRVLPVTLIQRPIKSQFVQSFLYYVPFVTLAVITFPAILTATESAIAGWVALIIGIIAALCNASLFNVAVLCCAGVFVTELILKMCL